MKARVRDAIVLEPRCDALATESMAARRQQRFVQPVDANRAFVLRLLRLVLRWKKTRLWVELWICMDITYTNRMREYG